MIYLTLLLLFTFHNLSNERHKTQIEFKLSGAKKNYQRRNIYFFTPGINIVICNELTVSAEVAPVTCVQTRSGKFNLPGDPFNKVQGLWEDCNGVKTDDSEV